MEEFNEAWSAICEYCKSKITDVAYTTWISKIEPQHFDFETGKITLKVLNDFHRQTLTRCYLKLLNEAVEQVFGLGFTVELTIPEEVKKDKPATDNILVDTKYEYTFDTFIVGSSNKFAHAAALAVATNPAEAYNPLFLYGNSGLGKTHLMLAIGNDLKQSNPDIKVLYVKGDDFTNELIESIQNATTAEFRQKYRQTDVLLVDDVQFIGGKERTQEEFFHTFNELFTNKKQIVLTSDRPPREIKTLEDRLRTRFESGLMADIQPPDLETRIAIIKRKAQLLEFTISDDVCEYIASNLKNNIRQLEGTVKRLKARCMLNGDKPTISCAHEIIADIINTEIPPEMTVEKIINEVARTFGVDADDIRFSKIRKAKISKARQIAIYITRVLTSLSMVAIGEEFGNRHYSTIVYTVQQIETDMENSGDLKAQIDDIIKNIRDR